MIDNYQVIMITGPRQVGKSTLLNYISRKLDRNINKVTLDDLILRNQAQEDPELFLRTHETPLIIDEFQRAPELLSYIKMIVDNDKEKITIGEKEKIETLYFLTGSQIFETMEKISESLAGRVNILDLFGLSEREIEKKESPLFIPNIDDIRKREKIYFTDTGLACYLAGYIDHITLEKSAYSGSIFETYVVNEIIKSFANHGKDARKHLYYYRDTNQKEIDLLINYNNTIYPIEIKKSANPGKGVIKNFEVANNFETKKGNGIVLCMAKDIIAYDYDNYIVPIEYI